MGLADASRRTRCALPVAAIVAALLACPPVAAAAPALGGLAGRTVVIDPGHNAGNAAHVVAISRPVLYDGAHSKPCDTVGTATLAGYPEYDFTWDVSRRLAAILRASGARVVLTRTATSPSWGPCITERAALGNRAHADVAISIHADGGPPGGRGFAAIAPASAIASAGLSTETVTRDLALARAVGAAYVAATGLPPSSYLGSGGVYRSNYYGGLDLSRVPKILLECGNMRNAVDAGLLTSAAFREREARGIAAGLAQFLRDG